MIIVIVINVSTKHNNNDNDNNTLNDNTKLGTWFLLYPGLSFYEYKQMSHGSRSSWGRATQSSRDHLPPCHILPPSEIPWRLFLAVLQAQ